MKKVGFYFSREPDEARSSCPECGWMNTTSNAIAIFESIKINRPVYVQCEVCKTWYNIGGDVEEGGKLMILKCVEQFEMAEIDENGNDTGEAFRVQEGTLWEVPREEYEALGFRDFIEELNEVDENGGFKGPFIMFVGVEEVKGCFEIFEEEGK